MKPLLGTGSIFFIYCSPSQWVHEILASQVDCALAWWEATRLQLTLQGHRGGNGQEFITGTGFGEAEIYKVHIDSWY